MASESNPERKQNRGRHKIEIKKVEQKAKRHVTFSKSKQGLFSKAAELSILSKAEIALLFFSQNGQLFPLGNPDPDSVVRRYLSGGSSFSNPSASSLREQFSVAALKQQYESASILLAEEQKRLQIVNEKHAIANTADGGGFRWNLPLEDTALEDLEQFQASMGELKRNLVVSTEMRLSSSPTLLLPTPLALPPAVSYVSLLNGDVREDQAWHWMCSGSSSIPMAPRGGLGQYEVL